MDHDSKDLRWLRAAGCTNNNNCVEVAQHGETVFLRSSLHPLDPVLRLTRSEFWGFVKSAAAGGFKGLIGEADQMGEGRASDGATPRSTPRQKERRLPRGNEEAARTAHPGVCRPLEGVFSLIIRVEPGEGRTNHAVCEAFIYGACAVVILASRQPAAAAPLPVVVAVPMLVASLRRVAKSVEVRWG